MLIMKSADWLLVARPILLVCISLADIGVTLYQKVGYHLSVIFSPVSHISLRDWLRGLGGGRPLLPEIVGQTDRIGVKLLIFDLFSPVAP